jgi:hypothetical protein
MREDAWATARAKGVNEHQFEALWKRMAGSGARDSVPRSVFDALLPGLVRETALTLNDVDDSDNIDHSLNSPETLARDLELASRVAKHPSTASWTSPPGSEGSSAGAGSDRRRVRGGSGGVIVRRDAIPSDHDVFTVFQLLSEHNVRADLENIFLRYESVNYFLWNAYVHHEMAEGGNMLALRTPEEELSLYRRKRVWGFSLSEWAVQYALNQEYFQGQFIQRLHNTILIGALLVSISASQFLDPPPALSQEGASSEARVGAHLLGLATVLFSSGLMIGLGLLDAQSRGLTKLARFQTIMRFYPVLGILRFAFLIGTAAMLIAAQQTATVLYDEAVHRVFSAAAAGGIALFLWLFFVMARQGADSGTFLSDVFIANVLDERCNIKPGWWAKVRALPPKYRAPAWSSTETSPRDRRKLTRKLKRRGTTMRRLIIS